MPGVLISGVAGRFPDASNIDSFWDGLLSGKDAVTSDDKRWPRGEYEKVPDRKGTVPDECIRAFDASFFGLSNQQADAMDPQHRMLLEVTREAITDASMRPEDLQSKRVGVFIAVSRSDAETINMSDPYNISDNSLGECATSLLANRVSRVFNFKGPSRTVNAECASSSMAIHEARLSLLNGECDTAIVGGVNLLLHPRVSQRLASLNLLSKDGKCKVFDGSGEGFVRSEAIVACVLTLESEKDHKNNTAELPSYAKILGSGALHGGCHEEGTGMLFPSVETQATLLRQLYDEAKIDPSNLSYIEVHGTGMSDFDESEVNAINTVLFNNSALPEDRVSIPIGSVKSNVGHCEAASGLVSIIKMCLAYRHQCLPANLHFDRPRESIRELLEKKFTVVKRNTPWLGGVAGVSSHGIGGVCTHILLTGGPSSEAEFCQLRCPVAGRNGIPKCSTFSCRTAQSLHELSSYVSREYKMASLPLSLAATASMKSNEHPYRGFIIQQRHSEHLPSLSISTEGHDFSFSEGDKVNGEASPFDVFDNVSSLSSPPLKEFWWVFTGMGAHWTHMGASLVYHPVFVDSIQQCQEVLYQQGVIGDDVRKDYLLRMIADTDIDEYNRDGLAATLALVVIQVGLVHLLRRAEVPMSHCTGHSIGEFAAAYASGHVTLRQTILIAYYRGKSLQDAECPLGCMAATGLSWEHVTERLSKSDVQVWPACHNGQGNTTISGDPHDVEQFVQELKKEQILGRTINSSGAAFHSPMMESAVTLFESHMNTLFANTQCMKRSSNWISSCDIDSSCLHANAAYFVKNFREPVRFCEAIQQASDSAVMIEIGSNGLFRSAIRATIPSVKYVSLQKKGADPLHEAFKQLGMLYIYGVDVRLEKLFTDVALQGVNSSACGSTLDKAIPNKLMYSWDHSTSHHVPTITAKISATSSLVKKESQPTIPAARGQQLSNIHASCIVDPSATIHPSAVIGPFTIIGPDVLISADCEIGKFCHIDDGSVLGEKTVLENSITITGQTIIGARNTLHSGVNIGDRGEWKTDMPPSGKVVIGDRNVIRENVSITRPFSRHETTVGSGCYIMHGATISHDVSVGDDVQIGPKCVLAGYCNVFRGCFLGMLSSLHQFTTVGAYSMIGMSSRITRDVPPCTTVVNNECVKINIYGITRNHGYSEADIQELGLYFQSEWPMTSDVTKTVFKNDMEQFIQCRTKNSSNRAIAPIKFGNQPPISKLPPSPSSFDADVADLNATLISCLRMALNLAPSQPIAQHQEFEQLGMDSLVTVALASSLSEVLCLEIGEGDISTNNTVDKLRTFIRSQKD